jgi:uncharacterized protein
MIVPKKNLVIKKSTLPGAGQGLFTRKFIPKGSLISEYKGRISKWKEANNKSGNNNYIYYITRNHVIDASPYKKSMARYANDARGLQRIKGLSNNSAYVENGLRVYIEAKKDIPPGSEILVDYGKEYWDAIRYNKKLEASNK